MLACLLLCIAALSSPEAPDQADPLAAAGPRRVRLGPEAPACAAPCGRDRLPVEPRVAETDPWFGSRLVVEALGGAGLGASGAYLGALAGSSLCGSRSDALGCITEAIAGGVTGALVGALTGVILTGRALGGRGSFLATLLGLVSGASIGVAAGAIALASDVEAVHALAAAGWQPVVGAIIGFEISNAVDRRTNPAH